MKGQGREIQARYEGKSGKVDKKGGGRRWEGRRKEKRRGRKGQESTRDDEQRDRKNEKSERKGGKGEKHEKSRNQNERINYEFTHGDTTRRSPAKSYQIWLSSSASRVKHETQPRETLQYREQRSKDPSRRRYFPYCFDAIQERVKPRNVNRLAPPKVPWLLQNWIRLDQIGAHQEGNGPL